jgi:hypothetical protein
LLFMALIAVPLASSCIGAGASRWRVRARCSAVASSGSPAYIRTSRATRSAEGSGSADGAQVSTAPRPRRTSGTVVLSAIPLSPLVASARPSHPVASSYGRFAPLSSICCASK